MLWSLDCGTERPRFPPGLKAGIPSLSEDGKDFEDALHLYLTFEDQFKRDQLETYVDRLGVEDYYAELRGI